MEVLTLIALCGIPLTYFMRTKASQPETPVGSGVKTANAAAG
jgi:hypothetical protein